MNKILNGLIVAGSLAYAQQPAYINMAGGSSCGEFLKNIEEVKISEITYSFYSYGFLNGLSNGDAELSKALFLLQPDNEAVMLYMKNYCKKNPLDIYAQGLYQLSNDLKDKL
jgi:hypothetical protein